jgi:hypothetical protein
MLATDEAELIRLNDKNLGIINSQSEDDGNGGNTAVVGSTVTITTYPTIAGAFYGMQPQSIFGDEVEGGAGTSTNYGVPFLSYNLGGAIPGNGTQHLNSYIDNRWVFRYDG